MFSVVRVFYFVNFLVYSWVSLLVGLRTFFNIRIKITSETHSFYLGIFLSTRRAMLRTFFRIFDWASWLSIL